MSLEKAAMPRFLKETCRYGNGGIRKNWAEKGEKIYMQQNRETEKQTGSAKETGKKIRAYLDNSSTTQPCREAVEAAARSMEDNWGNPSSLHTLGFLAEQEMRKSRETVAKALFCRPEEIVFTSGGTEADNIAVFGAAYGRIRRGKHIVTTAIEHPAVLNAMKQLEKEGFSVTYLMPDSFGWIAPEQVFDAVTSETILVSMMAVNNEVGSILPLEAAAQAIREKKAPALFHVDAVQAFGKIPLRPADMGVDLMTVSGHKIHGPKGIGALYIRRGVHLASRVFGGGQEQNIRPGTEPMPAISAFAAAVGALPDLKKEEERIRGLNKLLRERLQAIPQVKIHSLEKGIPYIVNLSAGTVRAETMLHFLAERGVFVSTGSACAKGKESHVLSAMGLPKEEIASSLRVSFSRMNGEEDVDAFACALEEGLSVLARKGLKRV